MSRQFTHKQFFQEEEEPTINLTPLIDVVFVILIMFIVIAPLLDKDTIQLADGKENHKETNSLSNVNAITIHVYKDNSLKYNNHKILLPELKAKLRGAKKENPNALPQIFHDRNASFGTYQGVKNAVEGAGFEEMVVVLSPS